MSGQLTYSTGPNYDVDKVADLHMGLFWDADAASGNIKGYVTGMYLVSRGLEEMELVALALNCSKDWDRQRFLRREGMAICLVSSKVTDGIWVYREDGVEVEGADRKLWGEEGGCLSRIFSVERS